MLAGAVTGFFLIRVGISSYITFWLEGVLASYYLTCVPEAVTIEVSSSIAVSVVAVGRLFASLFLFSLT